jgi:putative membrane protein
LERAAAPAGRRIFLNVTLSAAGVFRRTIGGSIASLPLSTGSVILDKEADVRGFLLRFLINICALWLTGALAYQINPANPGIAVTFWGAFSAVILLSFLNVFIAPVLKFLTLPLSCMTLGLFSFLINAFLFWMASLLIPGFDVRGFWAAVLGPIVMGILNSVLQTLAPLQRD